MSAAIGLAAILVTAFAVVRASVSVAGTSVGRAAIQGAVAVGASNILLAEGLSLFHAFTAEVEAFSWALIACAAVVIWRSAARRPFAGAPGLSGAREGAGYGWLWVFALPPLAVTLVQALVAAPNNIDSLSYHLPRALAWVQYQSIHHYPTSTEWDNAYPPGSSIWLAVFHMWIGSDRLSAMVQWLSYAGAALVAGRIAKQLSQSRRAAALAVTLVACLPIAISEAPTAQNDMVTALWACCFVSLALDPLLTPRGTPRGGGPALTVQSAVWLGLAAGVAVCTKTTAVFVLAPFALWLLWRWIRDPAGRRWVALAAAALPAIVLNSGWTIRNLQTYGSLFSNANDNITAQSHTPGSVLAVLTMNLASNLGTPWLGVNRAIAAGASHLVRLCGHAPGDKTISITEFRVWWINSENYQSSPLYVLLALAAAALCLWGGFARSADRAPLRWYVGCALGGWGLFGTVLLYQAFGLRLSLGLLVVACPVIALVLVRWRWVSGLVAGALCVIAVIVGAYSVDRPLVGGFAIHPAADTTITPPGSILTDSYENKLFGETPYFKTSFLEAAKYIESTGATRVGWWGPTEYPLWALLRAPDQRRIFDVGPMRALRSRADPTVDLAACFAYGQDETFCDHLTGGKVIVFGYIRVVVPSKPAQASTLFDSWRPTG